MIQILDVLNKIFNILSSNNACRFTNKNLFVVSNTEIFTPTGNILPLLIKHKSKLSDQPLNLDLLKQLVDRLNSDQSIVRLNHIVFCYKVSSQKQEKERLIRLIKQTEFHLYQEQSNDDGLWLFIGDTNK